MSWETNFLQPKLTLGKLSIKLLVPKGLQHNPQVLLMLLSSLGVHQNIIYEYYHKTIKVRVKNSIHIVHKHTMSINHTERHD